LGSYLRIKAGLAAALIYFVFIGPSQAQQFPSKPVVFVVPYAPGGNVDVSARIQLVEI
jgi:tripartite-type tricarboxylate transporter receptor subunit TctC